MNKILDKVKSIISSKSGVTGSIVIALLLIAGSVVLDVLAPNVSWMNYVRSLLALILSAPFFVIGYWIADKQHQGNVKKAEQADEKYYSYKQRYSANQRLNQSIIIAGCLIALAIISSFTPLYTVSAGIILAAIYGLVIYCQLTEDEAVLKDSGVDDPRDVAEFIKKMNKDIDEKAAIELRKEKLKQQAAEADADDDNDAE